MKFVDAISQVRMGANGTIFFFFFIDIFAIERMQRWCWCTILEMKITLWAPLFHRYIIYSIQVHFPFVSHMHSPPFVLVQLASVHKTELNKIISEMFQHMFRSPYSALGIRNSGEKKKLILEIDIIFESFCTQFSLQTIIYYYYLLTQIDDCASTYYRAICLNISNNNECV